MKHLDLHAATVGLRRARLLCFAAALLLAVATPLQSLAADPAQAAIRRPGVSGELPPAASKAPAGSA